MNVRKKHGNGKGRKWTMERDDGIKNEERWKVKKDAEE